MKLNLTSLGGPAGNFIEYYACSKAAAGRTDRQTEVERTKVKCKNDGSFVVGAAAAPPLPSLCCHLLDLIGDLPFGSNSLVK